MEVRSSCSNNSATGEELDCLNPRPSSSFEHSFASGSVPDNSQSTIGKFGLIFFSLPVITIHMRSEHNSVM